MHRRLATLLGCFALAGAGLACGDDDDGGEGASTPPATTAAPAGPAAGDVVTVDMKDILYVPRNATAKVGQTVRWTNSDPVAHTVTAKRGSEIDSGTIEPGAKFEAKFDRPGKVDYVCTIHPRQTGTVTVVR